MNIIYKLTNLEKESGRRFYIGSKTECFIEEINGVPTIVSSKTGYPYYGSATCPTMKADMAAGHRFSAEILEEVPDKANLLETENKWIVAQDAVNSEEYYNIAYARLGGYMIDPHAMFNMYGETVTEYGKARSSLNKKNNNAKKMGFKNLAELCIFIYKHFKDGLNGAQVGEILNWERHNPARYIKDYNMEKCLAEYDENDKDTELRIRKLLAEGVSIKKVAELTGLEIPTVVMYVGDYDTIYTKGFLVAYRRGMTKEELEVQVTKRILDGAGFLEVSRELSINETAVKRYFLRCVRRLLKSSDL